MNDNPFSGSKHLGIIESDLEEQLNYFPEQLKDALEKWRMTTLERERTDAMLYASFKGQDLKYTGDEIKSKIKASDTHYKAVLDEIKAEAAYTFVNERLMCLKKKVALRIGM